MDSEHLINHIRSVSARLDPIATGERPRLNRLPGIRAVVFDIYGTLFISGSGDISLAQKEDRSPALSASLQAAGFQVIQPAAGWAPAFMEVLQAHREARRREGVAFPEVRIEEVWQAFIDQVRESRWLSGEGSIPLAIVDYECRVNPVWPMPGLTDILSRLADQGIAMGIVSNAQFYTPLLFPALTGKSLSAHGIRERMCVWSYIEREGKPSPALYRKLGRHLSEAGIAPPEVLYLGNDRRNDIWPASETGFRTALFAGEARSLRWRHDDPDCRGIEPDLVVTELGQVIEALG